MEKFDVAIVGGGAAGLACAAFLIRNKITSVAVIERNDRLGKKLAATGNGQGNVTNLDMDGARYFGGDGDFIRGLIGAFGATELEKSLFHCVLTADKNGRVYPGGRQASALTDSLSAELKLGGARIFSGVKVEKIEKGFTLTLSDGNRVGADFVVLAVGGKAQKQFGTDGSGYSLATAFGHTVTPLYPSLVQLKTETKHIKTLKGIRTDCEVKALRGGKVIAVKRGDVIFTDYGVSGNAIFEISSFVTDKSGVTLSLAFLPDENDSIIRDVKIKKTLGYAREELLSGTLHNQLGRAVMRRCGSDNEEEILKTLKNFTLEVKGSLGFDFAQVTKGGIPLSEITENFESKFAKKLFLVGEMLDADGECGGYNLHWAFACAERAARGIASYSKEVNDD